MTQEPTQYNATYYRAALGTAAVALIFCLALVGLLVANLLQARTHDPYDPAQIDALKAELARQPENQELRERIRRMDQQIRQTYATTRQRAITGMYLLAGGIAVFLIAAHFATKYAGETPEPHPDAAQRAWVEAALSRRGLAALALVIAGFMVAMAVLGRHDPASEYVERVREAEYTDVAENTQISSPGPEQPQTQETTQEPAQTQQAVQGPQGPPGPQGSPGPQGPPGPPADEAEPQQTPDESDDDEPKPEPASSEDEQDQHEPGGDQKPQDQAGGIGPAVDEEATTEKPTSPLGGEMAKNWPVFRGPAFGQAMTADFPTSFDVESGENILWRTEVPLPGKNSPIYWDGKLFFSGATEQKRMVYCCDAETGEFTWKTEVKLEESADKEPPKVEHDTGYAAPSVATDGERVIAIFPNGDLVALDVDGEKIWAKWLGTPNNQYGFASSPLIHEGRVIIQFDQGLEASEGLSSIFALDIASGEELWRTDRPVPNSWSSPIIANIHDADQVVTTASPWVIGYDPEDGSELWRIDPLGADVGPSPAFGAGHVFATVEYHGLYAIDPPAPDDGDPEITWSSERNLPDTASPATDGNVVVTSSSYGWVTCYDAKEGTMHWEQDLGAPVAASPTIVGDRIYLADRDGVIHIMRAGPEFEEIATANAGEAVFATPAFVDGRIYSRTKDHILCAGQKRPEQPGSLGPAE